METEVKSSLGRCRCCLQYGCLKYMWGNHKHIDKTEVYGEMLTECYKIDWFHFDSEDHNQICEPCILKLREAYNFRIMVLSSQRQLINEICDDRVATIKVEPLDADEMLQEDLLKDSEFQNVEYLDPTLEAKLLDEKVIKTRNVKRKETTKRKSETTKRKLPNRQTKKKTEELNNLVPEKNVDKIENFFTQDVSNDIEAKVPKIEFLEMVVMNTDDSLDGNNDDVVNDDNVQYLVEATEKSKKEKAPKPPKIQKKPREHKRFLRYTEEDLRKGVEAVKNNRMSRLEAAEYYNVPRKTLTSKLKMDEEGPDPEREELFQFVEEIKKVLSFTNATPFKINQYYFCCAYCTEIRTKIPDDLRNHSRKSHVDERTKLVDHMMRPRCRNEILRLDINNLICVVCCVPISDWNGLFDHLKDTHGVTFKLVQKRLVPYILSLEPACVLCDQQFATYVQLELHMNTHYENYICKDCGATYITESKLNNHSVKHSAGRFKCKFCTKTFKSESQAVNHESVHRNIMFKCYHCTRRFPSDAARMTHIENEHADKNADIICDLCGKVFKYRQYFVRHLKTVHREKRFKCPYCNRKFSESYQLKNHIETHGRRKHICPFCKCRCSTKETLVRHLKLHSGDNGTIILINENENE